jgi:hypothetical protein
MNPIRSATQDQRSTDRRNLEAPVLVRFEIPAIHGLSDNLSSAGILLFTEEPLRVSIEIQEEGATKRFAGRLVRAQRLSETTTGLAIEFDAT